jgi:hypothetical protein
LEIVTKGGKDLTSIYIHVYIYMKNVKHIYKNTYTHINSYTKNTPHTPIPFWESTLHDTHIHTSISDSTLHIKCICIYVYILTHIYTCIYIHIYI